MISNLSWDICVVIRTGRTFIRSLIDLLKSAHYRPQHAFLRLNLEARSDTLWWSTFIESWNGLSMMHNLHKAHPDIYVTSDASGSWVCGAFSASFWFQYRWPGEMTSMHTTVKEFFPIVLAAAIWGDTWVNKTVLFRCDNEAVVHIINSGTSKDHNVRGLMRCLHFIAAHFNLLITAKHVPGVDNDLADALSRDNLPFFLTTIHGPLGSPLCMYQHLFDIHTLLSLGGYGTLRSHGQIPGGFAPSSIPPKLISTLR